MRRLRIFDMISIDGYYAGPDGNIDWHTVDDEFNDFAIELLASIDTIMFGRKTYQLFEEYWPVALKDPKTDPADKIIAKAINNAHKVVFSKSLKKVTWNNSELLSELTVAAIVELKNRPGKDIIVYGSGELVQELMNLGVIDELNLMVSPTVLGNGQPLFKDVKQTKLKLANSRQFKNGNVLLTY